VGKAAEPDERERMVASALDAGFTPVVDLTNAYDGIDPATLAIGRDDFHPNAEGHARLARRLEAALEHRLAPGRPGMLTDPSEGVESR
jgi:lysophospholipase L1-like esterase